MNTVLLIKDQEVPLSQLWYSEMSLSSARAGRQQTTYKLIVAKSVLLPTLEAEYENCVQELKRDDSITGTTDFFAQAGYPSLEVLLNQSALLSEVIATYFKNEIFRAILRPRTSSNNVGTYAIDSVTSVHCEGESFVIEGMCYAF